MLAKCRKRSVNTPTRILMGRAILQCQTHTTASQVPFSFRSDIYNGSRLERDAVVGLDTIRAWQTADSRSILLTYLSRRTLRWAHQNWHRTTLQTRDRYYNYSNMAEQFTARLNELLSPTFLGAAHNILVGDQASEAGEPVVRYLLKPKAVRKAIPPIVMCSRSVAQVPR